jgi:hypothetical protein
LTRTAALLVVVAAATAFADDDPDLPVVSGRVAADGGAPVRVTLDRLIAQSAGWSNPECGFRKALVPQGETFRFAGLPPGRYDLVVDGDDVPRTTRTIEVFDDVANLDVRPARATGAPASVEGKLLLEFDGRFDCCHLASGDVVAKILPDGRFTCDGLRAGAAWFDLFCFLPAKSAFGRKEGFVRRRVRVDLVAGVNHAEIRVSRNEDVRLAPRSANPAESFAGEVFDLDETPPRGFGEPFKVMVVEDADDHRTAFCHAIDGDGIDTTWWRNFGPALPLLGLGRGPHRVRIEAPGFETVERAFDVSGPTRVDVEMKPLTGQFVRLPSDPIVFVLEERRADRTWATLYARGVPELFTGRRGLQTPRVFLAPGVHVLRASTSEAPPSSWVTLEVGDDRREIEPEFSFGKGATMKGRIVTKAGAALDGFDVRVFRLAREGWERLRAQDAIAEPEFKIKGLAPGRYRFAFDESGERVFAEFEMADADVAHTFTFRRR